MSKGNKYNRFQKSGIVTIVAVYLLILVGGIVRSTGSGMGCPDWPKCFGSWVPPTEVSQLPSDYQQVYHDRGYAEVEFNVYKTWTEYLNRLLGALIGIFVFITLLYSIPYLKSDKVIFYLSLLSFILVGFQGWLGSVVVATNLAPWMVTIHMLVAIVIVCILIYTVARSFTGKVAVGTVANKPLLNKLLLFLVTASLIQIVLGTQVRETIDEIALALGESQRINWIGQLGTSFYIHRTFSTLILFAHVYLFYTLMKGTAREGMIYFYTKLLLITIIAEIIAGVGMAYFGIPAFLQPVHLLLAVVAIGIQFILLLLLNQEKVFSNTAVSLTDKQLSYR
ncbi:heme A synthase [Rhodocytophaga rosea]|uniref:Heme A synthase n=2 Tax=Rhodocytophaga rosea TaxID=2704465 RepID=A0A6C0GUN2_9BACT|nr:heme A synthase [Rhodocytophaga rosea]